MIPQNIRDRYIIFDPEFDLFHKLFREEPGKALEVGAHDAPVSTMLVESGFEVHSWDLRPYDQFPVLPGHHHHVGDFCDSPQFQWWWTNVGTFDTVISVSTLEHFGLGTYGEPTRHPHYESVAMHLIKLLLKKGGKAYISVPVGSRFHEVTPHWRVYDWPSLCDRIVPGFAVRGYAMMTCHDGVKVMNGTVKSGTLVDWLSPMMLPPGDPSISGLLVLQKE